MLFRQFPNASQSNLGYGVRILTLICKILNFLHILNKITFIHYLLSNAFFCKILILKNIKKQRAKVIFKYFDPSMQIVLI